MDDHTLWHGRKRYGCYCLKAFSTEEIIKRHIKDCFKINDKQRIKMSKKGEYVKLKNFESFLVPGDNGKWNLDELYADKYQKHVACSYG